MRGKIEFSGNHSIKNLNPKGYFRGGVTVLAIIVGYDNLFEGR
jgi:hypothetical protein